MKHLKSTSQSLKDLFDHAITVKYIAEPLASFDDSSDSSVVKAFMETHDYDVVGIRENGVVAGYVSRDSLQDGVSGSFMKSFDTSDLVSDAAPLIDAFRMLRERPRVYVIYLDKIGGLVTKGDLQKAPVRMWLFGLTSLLEMQLLRLIRGCHPSESWKEFLSQSLLDDAHKIFEERKAKNEEIDVADCLQFCDKRDILKGSDELTKLAGIESKKSVERLLRKAEILRNNLAHAQDIITGRWPEIADLAQEMESLLVKMEKVTFSSEGAV